MPNISINKSDLQDLGISLKDILLAITKSKNSTSDVIKIKKKKPRKNKNKKQQKSKRPTFSHTGVVGGGGSSSVPTVVTNVIPNNSTSDKDNQMNIIKNQIEDFKRDNEMKLLTQQNQLEHFQSMNHLGMRLIYNKLENPLTNISSSSFREPQQVNRNDGIGIIQNHNFYDNTGSGRVQFLDEEPPLTETSMIDILPTINESLPVDQPIEIPQVKEPISFETALEQEVQKEEKKRGRPKGSKNKPKNPLTQEAISQDMELPNTRSSRIDLTNPDMITPDRFAKDQMKKQEVISAFFSPRKLVPRTPIHLSQDGELVPKPPSEIKSSNHSKLPIPVKGRSRSANAIILG